MNDIPSEYVPNQYSITEFPSVRVQLITNCGMVLLYTATTFFAAIKEANDSGYKVVSAIQLGGV